MNRTLKALGLGLFAALAMSAFAVMGASADVTKHTGGHFTTTGTLPVKLHGHGGKIPPNTHQVKLHIPSLSSTVECTETYSGELKSATVESVTITPHYTECNKTVHMNGCTYTFTARDTSVSTLHNAIHLVCPSGKLAEVTSPGECTITFGTQTVTDAATYTRVTVNGKHAITAHITAKNITYFKHGLCEFVSPFGTGDHHDAEMTGTALITAKDALGATTDITATGTNNH